VPVRVVPPDADQRNPRLGGVEEATVLIGGTVVGDLEHVHPQRIHARAVDEVLLLLDLGIPRQ
jgi:hypothetical protein